MSLLGSIEGLGTKRIFGIYIGINQNLSKLSKFISFIWLINWYCLILSSHSSSSSLLSYTLPLIGISIAERLRDRGFDSVICFDDFSKHSKSYRQISLILAKIPSRDAFPSDIFNIHASILERCGKLKLCYCQIFIISYFTTWKSIFRSILSLILLILFLYQIFFFYWSMFSRYFSRNCFNNREMSIILCSFLSFLKYFIIGLILTNISFIPVFI